MDWISALLLLTGSLVVLLMLGLPVAVTFFGVNIIGAFVFLNGEIGLIQMTRNVVTAITNYNLAPIPLFILMGEILLHTGMAFKAIDAIERLITKVPGRMAVVTVAAGTVFSALSGSSIANTAMLGRSLMPEMLKRGYHPTLSMGPIMATGAIAMLIPPSALAVLVGSLAGMSISKLLLAGIIPALLMSLLFFAYIIYRAKRRPQDAPADDPVQRTFAERWVPFLIYVVPLSGILIVVVGSLILGVATPTESAGLGVIASFIAAAGYRTLSWQAIKTTLAETAKTSTMILFIIMASTTFSQILAFSGHQRCGHPGDELRSRPADGAGHDDARIAHTGLLHRPGQHGHDHRAAVHPHCACGRHRPDLAGGHLSHHHGDGLPHPAVRPAAVRHERHRAARDPHGHGLQGGDAVPGDRDVRAGAHPHLPANRLMDA